MVYRSSVKMCQMFGDKPNKGMYDNGVWQNILNIPYIEDENNLEPYDVIISTQWISANISGRSKRVKSRWPHKILLGLSDHPLSTHISKLPADQQLRYINDLQYLDGIMALTDEEKQWYSIAVPSKPVIKVGLPFPHESYETKYGHLKGSERKFIGLGVGASDNDRNFISSWLVFQRLRLLYPDIKGVFLSIPDQLISYCSQLADQSDNSVFIQQRQDMGEFYDTLSQCHFVINLADRNTPGRLQGEAAFFGVPVIGSDRLELQKELFPKLTVQPYALVQAFNYAVGLIENDDYYRPEDLTRAYEGLNHYSYRASKRKFNGLLKYIREE